MEREIIVMRRIRIDFYIAFVVAFGVGIFFNFCAGKVIDGLEDKSREKVYSDTKIGAAAGEGTPVVSSIEEMMKEEYFTCHVKSSIITDSVYYDGKVYHIYDLVSGETVLVDENFYNSYFSSDNDNNSMYNDSYLVLPVGRVVKEPLADELVNLIKEEGYELTDTSFYIDMRGEFKDFSRDNYEQAASVISFIVGFTVFLLVRYLMILSGVFPPVFPLRFLKSWKRYIIYYGVLYYGENVNKIIALHKQEDFEKAASEFSGLTGISREEALIAMEYWDDIYGEGII